MKRQAYPDDVSDAQWARVEALLPAPARSGAPPRYARREMLNAMLYVLRTGCSWRHLPHEFPPWGAVWQQWRRWRDAGVFERLLHALRARARREAGRRVSPSAAVLDSQSVKSTEKGGPGASTSSRRPRGASATSS